MCPLSSKALLADNAHRRQWAVPTRPWLMAQTWQHLLFAHWPISVDALRPLIPAALPIDTFDGQAWLGVVPFEMRNIRFRGSAPAPGLSAFPELNVRTYVNHDGKPGVWFFSLDAANATAVWFARRFYNLPYFRAQMRVRIHETTIDYFSSRLLAPATFSGTYQPTSEVYQSTPGTLEYWLTERYYLYAADRRGRLYRGAIQHRPWPLQHAEAELTEETTARSHGLHLPDTPPLLHYAHTIDVLAWPIEAVNT